MPRPALSVTAPAISSACDQSARAALGCHSNRLQNIRPSMAKATLKNLQTDPLLEQIGAALGCAISVAGLTQKEAAGLMHMPESQLADWIAGRGYIQTHRVMAVECLRIPFIRSLALWAGLTVRTSIDFDERRTA